MCCLLPTKAERFVENYHHRQGIFLSARRQTEKALLEYHRSRLGEPVLFDTKEIIMSMRAMVFAIVVFATLLTITAQEGTAQEGNQHAMNRRRKL